MHNFLNELLFGSSPPVNYKIYLKSVVSIFLVCNWQCSVMCWNLSPTCNTFKHMNYRLVWFLVKYISQLGNLFLECSQYFSKMQLIVFYDVVKFQRSTCNTFKYMNYCLVWFLVKSDFWSSPDGQTDGQTESDAYEPIVQSAQVGSIMMQKEHLA